MIPRKTAEQHGISTVDNSINGREELISKLRQLIPGVVTENGLIDVDALQHAIGGGTHKW